MLFSQCFMIHLFRQARISMIKCQLCSAVVETFEQSRDVISFLLSPAIDQFAACEMNTVSHAKSEPTGDGKCNQKIFLSRFSLYIVQQLDLIGWVCQILSNIHLKIFLLLFTIKKKSARKSYPHPKPLNYLAFTSVKSVVLYITYIPAWIQTQTNK